MAAGNLRCTRILLMVETPKDTPLIVCQQRALAPASMSFRNIVMASKILEHVPI